MKYKNPKLKVYDPTSYKIGSEDQHFWWYEVERSQNWSVSMVFFTSIGDCNCTDRISWFSYFQNSAYTGLNESHQGQ